MTVISVLRLVSVIEHRATTYPTFDPTWYVPKIMLLSLLEISLATVCACIPTFWPVVSAGLTRVFVTKEVTVTHSQRDLAGRRHPDDDNVELQRTSTASSTISHPRMHAAGEADGSPSGLPLYGGDRDARARAEVSVGVKPGGRGPLVDVGV